MSARADLTAAYLRSILHYDHDTGVFTWRARPRDHFQKPKTWKSWISRFSGKTAGCKTSKGYIEIVLGRKHYKAHRLAWLYMTGGWPKDQIDHANLNKADNRWSNLREATNAQNRCNVGVSRKNTSGAKGVCRHKQTGKWNVGIKKNGKRIHIGVFDDFQEASEAYAKAAAENFGKFARAA